MGYRFDDFQPAPASALAPPRFRAGRRGRGSGRGGIGRGRERRRRRGGGRCRRAPRRPRSRLRPRATAPADRRNGGDRADFRDIDATVVLPSQMRRNAAPRPVLRPLAKHGPHGIEREVPDRGAPVRLVHRHAAEAALEQGTRGAQRGLPKPRCAPKGHGGNRRGSGRGSMFAQRLLAWSDRRRRPWTLTRAHGPGGADGG